MFARIEGRAGHGVDRRHAFALEEDPQLAVDGRDALEPRVLSDRGRTRVDGAVEVVRDVEDLADEVLGGQAEIAVALLGGPSLVVEELGSLALERDQVVLGDLGRGVALGGQCLDDVEQGGRRDIDLLDALLRSGPAALRHRDDPPVHS